MSLHSRQENTHLNKHLQYSMIRATTKLCTKYRSSPNEAMIVTKNLRKDSLRREMPGAGFWRIIKSLKNVEDKPGKVCSGQLLDKAWNPFKQFGIDRREIRKKREEHHLGICWPVLVEWLVTSLFVAGAWALSTRIPSHHSPPYCEGHLLGHLGLCSTLGQVSGGG